MFTNGLEERTWLVISTISRKWRTYQGHSQSRTL